ncbi:MAG: hypothetical protein GYA21_05010 [Myxococcales bacterium]|nr:hypothetical protein [Myxococcales bacterium]
MTRTRALVVAVAFFLAANMAAPPALAHWCTNIYNTPSRIIVKPERDTVFMNETIGSQETLRVWVRNNFPYGISGVRLLASNSDFSVSCSPSNVTVMPGENKLFTLTITRTANNGDDNLNLKITLATHFSPHPSPGGNFNIDDNYYTKVLPTQSELDNSNGQAEHLMWQRYTELAATYPGAGGLDQMLQRYGHARLEYTADGGLDGSWHPNEHQDEDDGAGFDYWAFDHAQMERGLIDLAKVKVSDPRVQEAFLRQMDDPNPTWRGLAAVLAAGFTPGPAVRTRIETMANQDTCVDSATCSHYPSGRFVSSDDARTLAKAALVILGETQYQSEVNTFCYANRGYDGWRSMVCAMALGIAGQDQPVRDILIANTGDIEDLTALWAGYLLSAVAEHRRGPSGQGCVTFFDEVCVSDDVRPRPPQNLQVRPL